MLCTAMHMLSAFWPVICNAAAMSDGSAPPQADTNSWPVVTASDEKTDEPQDAADAAASTKPRIVQEVSTRTTSRLLLMSIWSLVLFVGLPLWISTTSTERRSLPSSQVQQWVSKTERQSGCPVQFPLPIRGEGLQQQHFQHPCLASTVVSDRSRQGALMFLTRS